MSGPDQYAQFDVFDYGATGDRGSFTYENFTIPGYRYTADVLCATVNPVAGTAWFVFQHPFDASLYIGVYITDGGSPGAGNDTYGHMAQYGSPPSCTTPAGVSNYPITAGNLVVHD